MKSSTLTAQDRFKQMLLGNISFQIIFTIIEIIILYSLLSFWIQVEYVNIILSSFFGGLTFYFFLISGIKQGEVSTIDAVLECKKCKDDEYVIHIGDETGECPKCKSKTRWIIKERLFSRLKRKELITNLALFARHNPQPLLRVSSKGKLTGANIAAENLFGKEYLYELSIWELMPQFNGMDFSKIISDEDVVSKVIEVGSRYFNMVLKGIKKLNSIHIYTSEITDVKNAEIKIKQQSEEIQSSIKYASYIQQSMLPHIDEINDLFRSNMVIYIPKDTVSGDFYWVKETEEYKIVVVADCTGHGVPGAMVCMRAISMLNDVVMRDMKNCPANILNMLRDRWLEVSSNNISFSDGMDMAITVFEKNSNRLIYAGANNPINIISENEIITLKADRMPIGRHLHESVPFTKQYYELKKGDRVFLYSDGFKDQFGGELNKKFSAKKFKGLLLLSSKLKMDDQKRVIEKAFVDWKGSNEQVDDVLVMGFEVE